MACADVSHTQRVAARHFMLCVLLLCQEALQSVPRYAYELCAPAPV